MQDETQKLAITLGLLLLIGGVLIGRELIGLWLTFGISVMLVVGGYLSTFIRRELEVKEFVRKIRNW